MLGPRPLTPSYSADFSRALLGQLVFREHAHTISLCLYDLPVSAQTSQGQHDQLVYIV